MVKVFEVKRVASEWDGADIHAYLKDEDYQCTFRYDPRDNDFVWEG